MMANHRLERMLLIVNPRAARRLDRPEQLAGPGTLLHRWDEPPEHELPAELLRTVDAVLVMGGDGTVHRAVNAMRACPRPLVIVPVGTANDFARSLGLPREPAAAATLPQRGRLVRVDLGWLGDTAFLNVAFAGWPAARPSRPAWARALGPLGYPLSLLGALGAGAERIEVCAREACHRTMGGWVAIANGPRFGGTRGVAQAAQPDEGLLDVLVAARGVGQWLEAASRPGRLLERLASWHQRVAACTLQAPGPITWRVDGERLVSPATVEARVAPGALEVWVP